MNRLIAEINALGHEISQAELVGNDVGVIRLLREKIGLHRVLLRRRRTQNLITLALRVTDKCFGARHNLLAIPLLKWAARIAKSKGHA
jgi:hypothetical protein